MKHTVRVTLEVDIEGSNPAEAQENAEDWAASVLDKIRPKCPTCRGDGRVPMTGGSKQTCWTCRGSAVYGEHSLRPRVVSARTV